MRVRKVAAASPTVERNETEVAAGVEYVVCAKCGVRQSKGTVERSGGMCVRCGEPLEGFALPAPAKVETRVATSQEEIQKQVTEGKLPPQEDFSQLCANAEIKGYRLTLPQAASLSPMERKALYDWTVGERGEPKGVTSKLAKVQDYDKSTGTFKNPAEDGREFAEKSAAVTNNVHVTHVATSTKEFGSAATDEGEEVSHTHGEEVYQVAPYTTFRVGPFTSTTRIRKGETRTQALARVAQDLADHAEVERVLKRKSFITAVKELRNEIKSERAELSADAQ
jgi:hypothetical protein